MSLIWQQQRSDLNHGWLKNRFVNSLGSDLENHDEGYDLTMFFGQAFPAWGRNRGALLNLIESFESENRPSRLLEQPPMNRLSSQDRVWMGELTDALWKNRNPVETWVTEAREAFIEADQKAGELANLLKEGQSVRRLDGGDPVVTAAQQLYASAQNLRDRISEFPHDFDYVWHKEKDV